ncbi:MAG: transposase [Bacteroidetes bacterium]|nr:transposase [Bacteroidota bacterium]
MKNQSNQKFSETFKRKVVMEVMQGKLSKESARRVYGIKGKSAVLYWIRQYSDWPETIPELSLESMNKEEQEQFNVLKRKIALLEEQLQNEMHRTNVYKTMIEIAETQLNIPIRKKYGANQFKHTKSTPKK